MTTLGVILYLFFSITYDIAGQARIDGWMITIRFLSLPQDFRRLPCTPASSRKKQLPTQSRKVSKNTSIMEQSSVSHSSLTSAA